MITESNFRDMLLELGFTQKGNVFSKDFPDIEAFLRVDFDAQKLLYPENKGLIINERQTCNFKANENFVVFECVYRLLDKGYKPEHIELEPKWKVGHGASGGRADILVKDNSGKALLIIECKTWGKEFDDAWKDTLNGKGQLFTYAHQERSTKHLCLYASGWEDSVLKTQSHIITIEDNNDIIKEKQKENPLSYSKADTAKELFQAWKHTYESDYATRGIFEPDVQSYNIGKAKYTEDDLHTVTQTDIQPKYHEFATILRQHNVSGRENAFDKLVNLFLCKIVDEKHNPRDLQFYWRGIAYDTYFDLIDRLQRLYRDGMGEFLEEDVTYIDNQTIRDAFKFFENDPDATREKVIGYFRQQKYFTNNDFSFLDVHNEQLFYQNAAILLEIVRMIQDLRLNGDQQNQFLGDMFEFFLDQGFKQTEGQFFTPLPITRFIVLSLPLDRIIEQSQRLPKVIDFACGAGHFLNEVANQMLSIVKVYKGAGIEEFYEEIYGIEKEYRLSKVAKVSAFMYNQDQINIIYADALAQHPDINEGQFDLLVSNPPYSVKGFLETLSETERNRFTLLETVDPKSYPTNNSIEAFFLERTQQLLAPRGVAGIIVPASVLSNSAHTYTRTREILLESFDIIALVELGSGTFGKTGTNTVTLFLCRKDDNPAPADHFRNRVKSWFKNDTKKDVIFADTNLLQAYCDHIEIPFDEYRTLLACAPSNELLQTDIFREYRQTFNNSTEVKNLKKRKSFKGKTKKEQQAELDERFLAFVREIEQDKIYYFVLAYTQSNPVLIVRSPRKTSEQKEFLGYEWSTAKGQEGIQYLHGSIDCIQTPLFDPADFANPEKISTLIQRNFENQLNSIPDSLHSYVALAYLIDLLDFSRVQFDKQISIAPKARVPRFQSKWPLQKLGSICSFEYGDGLSEDKRNPGQYPVIGSNGRVGVHNQYLVEGPTIIVGRKGTAGAVFWENENCWPIDTTFYVELNEPNVLLHYLFIVLKNLRLDRLSGGVGVPGLNRDDAYQQRIPIPPLNVQQAIADECQAIDQQVAQARLEIEQVRQDIKLEVNHCFSQGGDVKNLRDLVYLNRESINPGDNPEKEFTYIEIGNVENETGEIDFSQVIKGKNAPSRARRLAPQGCVIISTVRPNLKGFAFIEQDTTDCVFTTGFAVLESRDEDVLLNKTLYYAFMFLDSLMTQIVSTMGKSAYPSINMGDIKSFNLRVPPIAAQRKMISKIEVLESRLKKAQTIIKDAPAQRQAVLEKYL
jgi:type I restriction enzyme M protein